jgi:hypothetical protein
MTNNSDTTALSRIAPWHSANHRAYRFATIVARAAPTAMPMVLKTRPAKIYPRKPMSRYCTSVQDDGVQNGGDLPRRSPMLKS